MTGQPTIQADRFWDTLEQLESKLQLSQEFWLGAVQQNELGWKKLRGSRLTPPPHLIEKIAELLDLDIDRLAGGRIDLETLAQHRGGNVCYLPEPYRRAAFSRKRMVTPILDYIETYQGWQARLALLRRLQLTESAFADANGWVSLNLISDLFDVLLESGWSPDEFEKIGRHFLATNFHSPLAAQLREFSSASELLQFFVHELYPVHYDRNYLLRVTESSHSACFLEARPNPEAREALGSSSKPFGHPGFCRLVSGIIASQPGYLMQPFARVSETQCMHRGSSRCVFTVEFAS